MADLQRIESLLKAALDAGETEDAEFFQRQMYAHPDFETRRSQQLKAVDQDLNPTTNPLLGAARSGLQGLTFGFSDELAGGLKSAVAGAMGDDPIKAYREAQSELDKEQRQFTEENPGLSIGAELAGGILTGGAGLARSGATTAGRSVAGRLGRGAGVGAAEGGLYGAGTAREGERTGGAIEGAAVGAIAAPIGAAVTRLAGEALSPTADYLGRKFLTTPRQNAERYLSQGLAQEGVTPSALASALRNMGPNAILADTSTSARNALEGVIQQGDNPGITNQAEALFKRRQSGQQPRLINNLMEGLGVPEGTSLQQTVKALQQQRGNIAGPMYQEAFRQPLRRTQKLDSLMRAPAIKQALAGAQTIAANQRIAGDQISHLRLFDLAKQDLDDQIGRAINSGERSKARDLMRLKADMVNELDSQVPMYKQARDVFANQSNLIDSAQMGRRILLEDADYMDDMLKGMSESEKEMFRIGAGKAIRDKFMQAAESGDATKRINSSLLRERIRRAFPSEEAFNDFLKQVEVEADIYRTTAILGNSRTAARQQEFKRQQGMDIPGAEGGATGMAVGLIKRILGTGLNDEAKEELARLTMQRIGDIDLNALNQSIKKSALSDKNKEWVITRLPEFGAVMSAPAGAAMYNQAFNQDPAMRQQSMIAEALRAAP